MSDIVAASKFIQHNPIWFCREVLGLKPWSKQEEILVALRDHSRVAVRAAHGTGKSSVLAAAVLWFTAGHAGALTTVTANTHKQALLTIWAEVRKLYSEAKMPLGGDMMSEKWTLGPKWFAVVVSPDDPDSASGLHAPHLLQIVDEASGLVANMAEAFEGNMTGPHSKMVLSGNPLRPSGPFYDSFRGPVSDDWEHIHISAMEALDQGIPGLTDAEWIESRRNEWGDGSPAWQSRVLGEFPDSSDDALMPLSFVEHAERLHNPPAGVKRLGVDVARFGSDETVFMTRDDTGVRHIEGHRGWDTMKTTGRVISAMRELGVKACDTFVDDAGLGGGVTDRLNEQGVKVVAVNFGAGAVDNARFANVRAECYWMLRQALIDDFSLEGAGSAIGGQLSAINLGYTSKGQILLEAKEKIKKRVGRSPDHADALALTFAVVKRHVVRVTVLDPDRARKRIEEKLKAEEEKLEAEKTK